MWVHACKKCAQGFLATAGYELAVMVFWDEAIALVLLAVLGGGHCSFGLPMKASFRLTAGLEMATSHRPFLSFFSIMAKQGTCVVSLIDKVN